MLDLVLILDRARLLRRLVGLCPRLRPPAETAASMNLEYIVGAALTVLLTAYLVYALLRPERF